MDWVTLRRHSWESIKKYRYVILIFLLGLFLMCFPQQNQEPDMTQGEVPTQQDPDFSRELEDILSLIQGAGKVRVLLSYATGPETIFQQKEEIPNGNDEGTIHREPVVITDSQRSQSGLVRVELAPKYLGAVVLCQGADSAAIRLAIVEAVSNATGLSSNSISVLKMK